MDIEVRPATKTEQMYCYTQSDQIMGQTGCIGHLRADMGDSGDQFFHDWTSHCERLLTPEFDDELNQVINHLREDGGFLKSRAAVSAYCYRQIDSAIDLSSQDFAFRADTKDYSYLLRLNPQKGMYTVYCYCYKREFLDHHLHQAEKGIRFITSDYTALFRLPDGGKIRILRQDGTHIDRVCRYIDDYHVEIGSSWTRYIISASLPNRWNVAITRCCRWIRWRILPEIHAAAQRIEVMRDDRAEIPDLEQLLVGLRGLA